MGLFSKKQEPAFELPAKLEALLQMALKDGEITEKKLNVLRAEAAKHDISEDELDMIIESRLPKSSAKKQKEDKQPAFVSTEEVNAVINANLYSASDSITQIFQKYEILCDSSKKNLENNDREKLHRAQLTYVGSITSPSDKEAMLDLIAHALPYTKKDLSSKTLKTATNIGFVALKAVSLTAKVATLGIAGKAVDNLEQLAQQAIVTNAEELANAWQSKVNSLFADAKELAGGFLNGDRQFKTKLSELSEQYKQYK
jgi:hypothetical protein